MRVRTPTSRESMRRCIRTVDLLSAFLAAPIAIGLRDPSMFSGERFTPTVGYCVIGFGAALLMVIAFDLGRSVGHVSMREARFIVAASVAATALNAVCAFSVDRLDYVPRSLPLIQSLVLCALILGGRTVAASRSSAFVRSVRDQRGVVIRKQSSVARQEVVQIGHLLQIRWNIRVIALIMQVVELDVDNVGDAAAGRA